MKKILIFISLFLMAISAFAQKEITFGMTGANFRSTLNNNYDTLYVSNTFRVSESKGYTSVQSAIDDATAGDLIIIYPGTYNEALTVTKDLTLHLHNAILEYDGENTNATITNSANLYIYDGIISRSGTTVNCKLIQNSDSVYLYNTYLKPTVNTSRFWYIYSTGGEVYFNNVNTYHKGTSKRFGGGSYFNDTKTIINGLKYDGIYHILGNSIVDINILECYMNGEMIIASDDASILEDGAQLNISVKERWGEIPNSGNIDSLDNTTGISVFNQAKLYIHDGIFNFYIGSNDTTEIKIINTYNDYGTPNITSTPPWGDESLKWEIRNSVLKFQPFPWETVGAGGGLHIFETNFEDPDTAIVDLTIDNSYLSFGVEDDDTKWVGNIFQDGWKGKIELTNSTFIHYSDDGNIGYKFIGSICSCIDYYIYNNKFISYGDEDGWMLCDVPGYDFNAVIINNIFNFYDDLSTVKAAFVTTEITYSPTDSLIFSNNLIYGNGNQSLFRTTGTSSMANIEKYLNQQSTNGINYEGATKSGSRQYARGVNNGNVTAGNALISDGLRLAGSDTIARTGGDGDSLLITIYYNDWGRIAGNQYPGNKTDFNSVFYINRYNPSSYPRDNGVYDVRFITISPNEVHANNRYFISTATKALAQTITYYDATIADGDYSWARLLLVNGSAYPIEITIWIKQSLNVKYIETIRF